MLRSYIRILGVLIIAFVNILFSVNGAVAAISEDERNALIAFYNATGGDDWTDNSGWKTEPLEDDGFATLGTECSWYGIDCDGTEEHVIYLLLPENNLIGYIPSDIGTLTDLQWIRLYDNELTGTIPSSLGSLTELMWIRMEDNQLYGTIPDLSALVDLDYLDLSNNYIEGSIPTWIGDLTALTYLNLSGNYLYGTIPDSIGDLINLQELHLNRGNGGNQLYGTIPDLSALDSLYYLNLSGNELEGSLPDTLGDLASLQTLYIASCPYITGSIPESFNNLTNLIYLYLDGNDLTGTIPDLSALTNLVYIDLSSNNLEGSIPSWLGDLTSLFHIDLCYNELTGSIPDLSGLTGLVALRLTGNHLTGTIPDYLGDFTGLFRLWLSRNQFEGNIPTSLGNLTALEDLYLNGNQLTGEIPTSLTSLTSLANLMIDYNALYTDDADLITFLDGLNSGWADTQTIDPENVTAGFTSEDTVLVEWTPVSYTADPGAYDISYSNTEGGPYTLYDTTADKSIDQMEVTGLETNTPYYFVVQTWTDSHESNQNTVYSDYSSEAYAYLGLISQAERDALIAIYNNTDGDNWADNSGWKDGTLEDDGFAERGTECTWYGVTCDGNNETIVGIDLSDNNLTGSIPSGVVDLTDLTYLDLSGNQLEGSILSDLGNLASLETLFLSGNQLTGEIPTSLTNLASLTSLSIDYNALYTDDADLITFLDGLNSGWDGTQTVAPEDVTAGFISEDTVLVEWTPVSYTTDPGAYEISYSNTEGGPYTLYNTTEDKSIDQMEVTGLETNTPYYFVVQTRTDSHGSNQNTVYSDYSSEAYAYLGLISQAERDALIALYNNTDGDNWADNSGWKDGTLEDDSFAERGTECSWYGVTCDDLDGTVVGINLPDNDLTGSIHSGLDDLTNIESLDLSSNQLEGSIPSDLGSLVNLETLYLNSNKLTGEIPTSLTSLISLTGLDISYNALYTDDADLITFLDGLDSGWADTQTIAPEDVTAEYISVNSVLVEWTPVSYTDDPGVYQIFYSTTTGGPYTLYGMTVDKSIDQMDVSGLEPGIPYYFVVRTRTNSHAFNQNTVYSDYSEEVDAYFALISQAERDALIALYNSTDGGNWVDNSGWKDGTLDADGFALRGTECSWYGVTCDGSSETVVEIDLSGNDLTGSIPSGLDDLIELTYLDLSDNQLEGSIPSDLGNLVNLETLYFNSSQLTGEIPTSLTNLSSLINLDISYNALHTDDADLITFLDGFGSVWGSTQTVAPENLKILLINDNSIVIEWTPVSDLSNPGCYRIYYSTTPGGPYTFFGTTENKTNYRMNVTGLTVDTTYYFVVRTQTDPNSYNQYTVLSDYSEEVSATTERFPWELFYPAFMK